MTRTAVAPTTAVDISLDALIRRAADLKGELLAFAESPRFARRLNALLADAADHGDHMGEVVAVATIDHFALQYRLPNGRTVLEQFLAQRRPRLSADERAMMLGWADVVEGCFEFRGMDGDAGQFHNLLDDVVYRVYSNMGPRAFSPISRGMFAVCRIVPLHPATDVWLISGHVAGFAKSARRQIAQSAAERVSGHPELMRRNPELLRRAWEMQAEHRRNFIAVAGSDLVILPPDEAQEMLLRHFRRLQEKAAARLNGAMPKYTGPGANEIGRLSPELLDAETVGLVYDEIEGLNYLHNLGRLDALFADPELARDRANLEMLRIYLYDDSVSPLAIRRMVQRHPDGADPVFRALLRKPGFSWSRDGEKLLRREKPAFFDGEPTPRISLLGNRLTELLT